MSFEIEHMAASNLFNGFAKETLESMACLMRKEVHDTGAVVFSEGEEGKALYLITEGSVRLSKEIEQIDKSVTFIDLSVGEVFGEMALLSEGPRTATCTVVEAARFLVLSRQRMADIALTDPRTHLLLVENLTGVVCDRLREVTRRLTELLETQIKAEQDKENLETLLAQSKETMLDLVTPAHGIKIVKPK